MLNNATIGQFFPGDSFLYKVDPRTKLLLTIAMIVIVFVAKGFIGKPYKLYQWYHYSIIPYVRQ